MPNATEMRLIDDAYDLIDGLSNWPSRCRFRIYRSLGTQLCMANSKMPNEVSDSPWTG